MEPKSPSKLKLSIMGFSQFKGWFKMSIVFVVMVVLFLGAHLGFQLGEGGVVVVVLFLVKEHSFSYRKSWIRVLSGKEEAYYGWVALNYKGRFMNHSRLPTLGLLDLGGSSLQVVMEVDDVKEDTHYIRSKLGFIEHQILAYSLPVFGLNEAFDRTVVLLSHTEALSESNSGVPNWDECKILARVAATNSSSLDWSWSIAAANYKAKLCLDSGNGILNLTAIALTARFHALSGFFAIYDKLNLSPKANLTKIWEKGQHLCSRSWTNSGNDCFRVPYMASVIEDALCLGDREILFGPGDVSWTLGAALVEGENIWLDTATSQIINLTPLKIISSPIFVFVLLLCILSIVHRSQVKLPMLGKKSVATGASSLPYIHPKRIPN